MNRSPAFRWDRGQYSRRCSAAERSGSLGKGNLAVCARPRASIEPSTEDRPMNQQVRIADWLEGSRALQTETIELRRSIHREPELGLKTPKTLAKVKAALAGLPLQLKSGPSTTGLIAI